MILFIHYFLVIILWALSPYLQLEEFEEIIPHPLTFSHSKISNSSILTGFQIS